SASADVKVWDLQAGIESAKLKGKAATSSVPEQLFGVEVASFTVADLSTAVNVTFESAHYSEIKGIAFSPFNSHLMCSGGLDKRIVLYDVGKKTTLKSIHTDTPLTALGFKADGVTVAAGTLQ
ncbi:22438_t:CDS:2, partial [Racocetra persica]